MKAIILGAPGSGKGTVTHYIQEKYKIQTLSTGDALRREIEKGSELGKFAASKIDKGEFVPDEVVTEIVQHALQELSSGYILDGFPRNEEQIDIFEQLLANIHQQLDVAIFIDVETILLQERLVNRLICPTCGRSYHRIHAKPQTEWLCDACHIELVRRKDDSPEFVAKRLQIYRDVTEPVITHYQKKGLLYRIDGNQSIDLVEQAIDAWMEKP